MDNSVWINIEHYQGAQLATSCIVCDESIPLTQNEELALRHGHHIPSKICDKCKAAILYMREQMP